MFLPPEAFNITINSVFSFFTGAILVWLILTIFRFKNPRLRYLFWLLPFVKIAFDVFMGTPNWACVNKGVELFSGPPFTNSIAAHIGFSMRGFFVIVDLLNAQGLPGQTCSWCMGDVIQFALIRYGSSFLPQIIFTIIIAISVFRLVRRVTAVVTFERRRSSLRNSSQSIAAGFASSGVDTYISLAHSGSPFTGGIFSPYICFPSDTYSALSAKEAQAVWQHEMAHVRWRDSAINLMIDILGDLFWFVPGYQMLKRQIFCERELSADAGAISSGTNASDLSLAMLTLCEHKLTYTSAPASYAGLFSHPQNRLINRRVSAINDKRDTRSTRRFFSAIGGWAMWLLMALTLSASSIGGYAPINTAKDLPPRSIEDVLKSVLSSLGING